MRLSTLVALGVTLIVWTGNIYTYAVAHMSDVEYALVGNSLGIFILAIIAVMSNSESTTVPKAPELPFSRPAASKRLERGKNAAMTAAKECGAVREIRLVKKK